MQTQIQVIQKNKQTILGYILKVLTVVPRVGRVKYFGLSAFWLGFFLFLVGHIKFAEINLVGQIFFGLISLICVGNLILLAFCRLNDFNARRWWALLMLIPSYKYKIPIACVKLLFLVCLALIPGAKGPNRYGERVVPTMRAHYFLMLVAPLALYLCFF